MFLRFFNLFFLSLSRSLMACDAEHSHEECNDDFDEKRTVNSTNQPLPSNTNKQSENCLTNGICSHEILQDGETNLDSEMFQNRMMRKVTLIYASHFMSYFAYGQCLSFNCIYLYFSRFKTLHVWMVTH